MSEETSPKRYLIGGAAACAVCCAPPVLALLGIAGTGAVATAATLAFAGLTFALVVAALAVVAFVVRRRRGRHPAAAATALAGSGHDARPLPDPVRRSGTD